jgi:hypothetical protein
MSSRGHLWGLVILCAALAPAAQAGQPAEAEAASENAAITIGTYKPQAAFEQSPDRAELMKVVQSLRQEMTTAQQAQDRQKMMAVQQKFQQAQQRITGAFEKKVRAALPDIAKTAGVKIIAVDVAYSADDVAVKDVTKQLIATIGDAAEAETLPMPLPEKK